MSFLKTLGITVDSDPRVTVTSATVTISEEERAAKEQEIEKFCALNSGKVASGSEQMQRVYAYTVKNKEALKASLRAITRDPIQSAELLKAKRSSQEILRPSANLHRPEIVLSSPLVKDPLAHFRKLPGLAQESSIITERLYPDLSDLPKFPSWIPTRLIASEPLPAEKPGTSQWLIRALGSMWRSAAYAVPLQSFLESIAKAPKEGRELRITNARIFMESVRTLCPDGIPMKEKIAFYEAAIQAALRSYSSKALLPQKADVEEMLRLNFYVGVVEEFIPKVREEFSQDGEPDEAILPFLAIRSELIKLRVGEKQAEFSPEKDLMIQALCFGDQRLHWYSLLHPVRELHDAYHKLKGRIERGEATREEQPFLPLYHRRWQQHAWALQNVATIQFPDDYSTGEPITLEQARAKLPPMPSVEELVALIKQKEKQQKVLEEQLEREFVVVEDFSRNGSSRSVSKHASKHPALETRKKKTKAEGAKVGPQLVSSDPSVKLKLLIERIETLKANKPSPKRNQQLHDLFDKLGIDKVKVKYAIYDAIGKKAEKIESLQREYGRIHFTDSLSALQSILRDFLSKATNSVTNVALSRLDERAVIIHPSTRKCKGYVDVVMRGKEPFYKKDDNWYIRQPVGVRYRLYHKLSMEERGKWVQEVERFHRKHHAEFFPQWSTSSPSEMTDIFRTNYLEPMIKTYPDKRVMQSVQDLVNALEVGENEESLLEYINRIPKRFFDDATFLTFVREQALAEGVKIEAWKKEWAKHHYKDDTSSLAQVIMRWFDHRISRYYEKTYGL